jgi:hypothetical protein
MIKVICDKCGAENFVNEKEMDRGKYLYCLACKAFFFKIGFDGKVIKAELDIT